MKARAIIVRLGLVAAAATHLWCSSDSEEAPGPGTDAGLDTGTPEGGSPDTGRAPPPVCTDALCRVTLPDANGLSLDALWAKSANEVWVVGSFGYAAKFDGTSWRRIPTGTKTNIFGVTGTSDGTVWGASSGYAFMKLNREADGGVETVDAGYKGPAYAIAAAGATVYAVGLSFDPFNGEPQPYDNIWRYKPGGDGGGAWTPVSPRCPMGEWEPKCLTYRSIWSESVDRQWFAGDDGKVYRSDTSDGGVDPDGRLILGEVNSSALRRLNGLWGFSDKDIWAVGAQGVIRHFTGGPVFEAVTSPVIDDLYGVWGSRPDDVWAVGDHGVVLHWDGKAWSVKEAPFGEENRPRLYAVAGTGSDVWIAGESTLLRSRGASGGDQ